MRAVISSCTPLIAGIALIGSACAKDTAGVTSPDHVGGSMIAQGVAAPAPTTSPGNYFVAPNGTSQGDGSAENPWDLTTALTNEAGTVQPGDTIWLRGGTYPAIVRSRLRGTPASPILVRGYPGERPVVDGFIEAYGAYTTFWGFEIMQSDPLLTNKRGLDVRGPGHRLVNLVIHDVGGSGVGFWMEGVDAEVYGCIIYNNGSRRSLDHGIYAINRDGTKSVSDNILFDNFAYGIHVYASSGQALNNVSVTNNTSFNNGSIARDVSKPNLFIGGSRVVARGMLVEGNTLYYSYDRAGAINMRLGYDGTQNEDIVVRNNYVVGGNPAVSFRRWNQAVFEGNTIAGVRRMVHIDQVDGQQWSGNSWYRRRGASAWDDAGTSLPFDDWRLATGLSATDTTPGLSPTDLRVVVQPNKYEPGRANVIVNNWPSDPSVAADLSSVLQIGDHFEVHSVQDLFGAPVVSGTYDGSPVQIPMQVINPPMPIGRTTTLPPPTGPLFDAFLVQTVP